MPKLITKPTKKKPLKSPSKAKKEKNPAAVALGSLGGKARSKNLTPEERTKIAKDAAIVRWKKPKSHSK